MTPSWFPWIVVGGFVFVLLSFVAAKYKQKEYRGMQFLQDFISGSILIGFVGVFMPDTLPKIEIPAMSFPLQGGDGDFDLQVGPPRLVGR
jgi:hypothetical protein